MGNYVPPSMKNVGIELTEGGYTAPGMRNVPIVLGEAGPPLQQSTADLQAAINVLGLYQTSTYTYEKSKPVYSIGYGDSIQILKGRTIYGGIRDIGGYIYGNPEHVDLVGIIVASLAGVGLPVYIKGIVKGTADLYNIIKPLHSGIEDLFAQINGQLNKGQIDLSAYIYGFLPAELSAYLNVISVSDLPVNITGDYLKGTTNLGAVVTKIFQRGSSDLGAYIAKLIETAVDLPVQIVANLYVNLPASIHGFDTRNLSAYLFAISPVDLQASLQGFDYKNLIASITGGFGPYDVRASINAIPPSDLSAAIDVYKEIEVASDLSAIISGLYAIDLPAVLNAIAPSDLPAYLNAIGKVSDLEASIYPMVLHLKKIMNVSLLEHQDLWGIINAHCFDSRAEDLTAYIYPIMKSDLPGNIVGWYGGFADNLKDLSAYINVGDYSVEDTLSITTLPSDQHTKLKITFSDDKDTIYKTFDTLQIKFGSFFSGNLSAYIKSMPRSSDITASISAVQQAAYRQAPQYVDVKNREVVINIDRFEPQWRRVAELFFDNQSNGEPFHYFYVSGENKVYRVNRSKHWTIRAVGYTRAPEGNNITRQKIWRKYIFDMTKYDTVDDAVRDLIDRVTFLRRNSLGAYINGVLPPHKDLTVSMTIKSYYHWVEGLNSIIKPQRHGLPDLPVSINAQEVSAVKALSADITSVQPYNSVDGNLADFNFVVDDAGYIPPDYDDSDYEFDI